MFRRNCGKCIRFIEGRKREDIWLFLFSMLFSVMLVASRHIVNAQSEVSTVANVYVTDFHFLDVIAWAGLTPVIYILMKAAAFSCAAGGKVLFREKREGRQGIRVLAGSFALLMVFWFPYLPSYWPGGIYADTVDSIRMALDKAAMDNHNPVLYTLIWRFMFWITGAFSGAGEYGGLKLFTVVQMLVMAFALAYFIYRCYRRGLRREVLLFFLLVFALFPLYPFYGISLWKDTLFSVTVFLFSVYLYRIFCEGGGDRCKEERSGGGLSGFFRKGTCDGRCGGKGACDGPLSGKGSGRDMARAQLAEYGLFSFLIIFLRNNGIYVVLFYSLTAAVLLLCLKRRAAAVKLGAVSFIVLLVSGIIQGPVYDRCGYNLDKTTESLGIPLQQAAYIIATDGEVAQEDWEVIGQLLPAERWKELYNPVVADTIKFSPVFNRAYLEENAGGFMRMYRHLVFRNPVKAVKAYMLSTMGFWDIFENSSTAYICNFHFGNAEYFMSDYFDYYLGISFRDFAEPKGYLSAAVFAWLLLGAVFICIGKRNWKGMIALMPTLGVWLSIMAAVPVAFSFRYVYALFLCVPLYLLICAESFRQECP